MAGNVLGMLGLCAKAGKLKSGEFSVDAAIKSGTAWAVIIADDASDNTKKSFTDSCSFYEVPYKIFGTKELLGHAIGKATRATIAITDEGFAESILNKLN